MQGAEIGADCNICDHTFVESGARLGSNVTVKNGVAIWDRVEIGDNVFLGPNCVLTNDPNPRACIKKTSVALVRTIIHSNTTIGANATIVCGITLGQYTFVAAGAVVIRSTRDFALVAGNPAKQIGWMCRCARRLPLSASATDGSTTECRDCKIAFQLMPKGLSILTAVEEK
jgi:acetyltransferase-like isoleucine patch superfamily enzyme